MLEKSTNGDEAAAAFRAGLPYIDKNGHKWVAGLNVGGVFFDEITEVPMSARELFANSRVGRFISAAREVLSSRT